MGANTTVKYGFSTTDSVEEFGYDAEELEGGGELVGRTCKYPYG